MEFSKRLKVILALAAVMIAVQVLNSITGNGLIHFGIIPRNATGLRGIVFAPFLHGSIQHLLSNLLPFIVLSWLVATEGVRRYAWVAGLVCLLGGLLVWSFGRSNIHVGASGLIFGFWAYLLARAWYQRSIASVLVALLVLAGYSGLVFGFVPVAGISFESHIAGALAGICVAWLMHSKALLAQK
ncbi:Rhomboid family protein [Pseudomonas amygdali pv. dendropanacis]|uniref:Rhomboid family protein n=1 Tax=Pseudomonas amygdali pv. dendropanacis TaxID=235272 RepID=A0A0N8RCW9_PSEA0|nr:rhomboid family intramembrane serine protease [Pseudomonas amygdali]KPX15959.1 Rhomboid family protein [Pseudomonas amygdali pv. dendropanacis]KWS83755.1 rhomboid family intramembrane serine protease [Pseudomonas amygdali pv. dendropanacis]